MASPADITSVVCMGPAVLNEIFITQRLQKLEAELAALRTEMQELAFSMLAKQRFVEQDWQHLHYKLQPMLDSRRQLTSEIATLQTKLASNKVCRVSEELHKLDAQIAAWEAEWEALWLPRYKEGRLFYKHLIERVYDAERYLHESLLKQRVALAGQLTAVPAVKEGAEAENSEDQKNGDNKDNFNENNSVSSWQVEGDDV